jgi:G-protein coupled receptor 98
VEPVTGTDKAVHLTVIRDGTFHTANVNWNVHSLNGLFTEKDVMPFNGTAVFKKGVSSVNITIHILADDEPELDEVFRVNLTTSTNSRLRTGASLAMVTIKKNDNPGGVFQFSSSSSISLLETSSKSTQVIRTGGNLEKKVLRTFIQNGSDDFEPATQTLTFPSGSNSATVFIFPKNDVIPELKETFTMHLVATDSDTLLGNITSINLEITANDDPHGIVSFTGDMNITIKEPKHDRIPESSPLFYRVWAL